MRIMWLHLFRKILLVDLHHVGFDGIPIEPASVDHWNASANLRIRMIDLFFVLLRRNLFMYMEYD